MGYLLDHWQGRHPLPRAFWINFLIPFILLAMGEVAVRPPVDGAHVADTVIAFLYLVAAYLVILPWQLVGLWRSIRRYLREQGDVSAATFAQAGMIIALISALGSSATTLQRVFGLHAVQVEAAAPPAYELRLLPGKKAVLIDGPIANGLSRDVKALLAKQPSLTTVILNSNGGRIFEARGLAKQIIEQGLDTHVIGHCRSACTIAFIAGKSRSLGERGLLGFHSYRLDGMMAFIDPLDEQEKDRAFFLSQGLDDSFVAEVFATPHEEMWQPRAERLLRSGVVHRIVGEP
jgi:hypothetical protein